MSSNLSPKKYIINNCRSLPVYECYLNKDWKTTQMANVLISRKMKAGNLCVGIFLVDLLCMGVKDTAYQFNLSLPEYNDFLERMTSVDGSVAFKKVDYSLVHNIIYEGIAFADDCGLQPHKDFAITKFFLNEDDDLIELIDIPLGDDEDGLPIVFSSPHEPNSRIIAQLTKKLGPDGFHIYRIDDDGELIYNDEDNDGENEIEMSCDWENNDPEIPSEDDMKYLSPNNDLDKIFNAQEHPISKNEFREEIVNYFQNNNSKNIFALNVLFKEYDQQPYGFMSKPLKDDILFKIYDLMVDHTPLDEKVISEINVWDQQLEIVDSEDDDFMLSLDPEVEKIADKALVKFNKGKDKKTKDLLKKLLSFPDDVKNEAYYYYVNKIAINIDEKETALSLAKEYKEKYPNIRSMLNYLNHLTTLLHVDEFDREFGDSYCISNVLNTKRVSIPDLASYLKILSLRLSLIDSRYGAEILKVVKAVPLQFREEFSQNIVPVFMSFILKGRVLDEIYRKIDGEDNRNW